MKKAPPEGKRLTAIETMTEVMGWTLGEFPNSDW